MSYVAAVLFIIIFTIHGAALVTATAFTTNITFVEYRKRRLVCVSRRLGGGLSALFLLQ